LAHGSFLQLVVEWAVAEHEERKEINSKIINSISAIPLHIKWFPHKRNTERTFFFYFPRNESRKANTKSQSRERQQPRCKIILT
jgi:hypothetical protein